MDPLSLGPVAVLPYLRRSYYSSINSPCAAPTRRACPAEDRPARSGTDRAAARADTSSQHAQMRLTVAPGTILRWRRDLLRRRRARKSRPKGRPTTRRNIKALVAAAPGKAASRAGLCARGGRARRAQTRRVGASTSPAWCHKTYQWRCTPRLRRTPAGQRARNAYAAPTAMTSAPPMMITDPRPLSTPRPILAPFPRPRATRRHQARGENRISSRRAGVSILLKPISGPVATTLLPIPTATQRVASSATKITSIRASSARC